MAIFLCLFCNKCQLILYFQTMYIYCVYHAMSESPKQNVSKQLSKCLKIAETSVVFNDVLCEVSMLMLLPYMLIFFDNVRVRIKTILFIFLQPWNLLTSWSEFTVPVVINFKWEYIYIFIQLFYNKILIYTGIYLLILASLFVNVFGIL